MVDQYSFLKRILINASMCCLNLLAGIAVFITFVSVLTYAQKNSDSYAFVFKNIIHSKQIEEITGGERWPAVTCGHSSGMRGDLSFKQESITHHDRFCLIVVGKKQTVSLDVYVSKGYGDMSWHIDNVLLGAYWPPLFTGKDITDNFALNNTHAKTSEGAKSDRHYQARLPVDNLMIIAIALCFFITAFCIFTIIASFFSSYRLIKKTLFKEYTARNIMGIYPIVLVMGFGVHLGLSIFPKADYSSTAGYLMLFISEFNCGVISVNMNKQHGARWGVTKANLYSLRGLRKVDLISEA